MSKKLSLLAAPAFVLLLLATSCSKSPMETMWGSYTYKTSGILGLLPVNQGLFSSADTVWHSLTTEQGQMNVVTKDEGNSVMVVTWNDVLGDACSTEATVDGDRMILAPAVKTVTLTDRVLTLGRGVVKYSGTGTRYDNMLVIPLKYEGMLLVGNDSLRIVVSKVECVAKAN